jgi:hypothetical protein
MADAHDKRRAALSAALVLGVSGLAYYALQPRREPPETPAQAVFAKDRVELVTTGGVRPIDVELAVSMAEQAQGLMYRTKLADTEGMLFLHDSPREVRMWMRNTYIPLDMVFIKADGTVHRIAERAEPLSDTVIASEGDVAAVLELNGGAAERLGLKPGDQVRHARFRGAAGSSRP